MLPALSTTRAILNCPSSRTEPAMGTDVFLGNPEYGVDLHPIDFVAFANACGGVGFSVEDPGDCGRTLEEFLAVPGPAILQATVDAF